MSSEDAVDHLVSGWEAALPEVNPSPLHVFSRITRLSQRLDTVRRGIFADLNLQIWEFDVLSALRRSLPDFELTVGKLLTETLVTSGTMTNRIDRLVERGLVTRIKDPNDKRIVKVMLAEDGVILVDEALTGLLGYESRLLSLLSSRKQCELTQLLKELLLPIEGELSGSVPVKTAR
ncbi:Multiple antibiotic resistance protein MarR [compost metagenome]